MGDMDSGNSGSLQSSSTGGGGCGGDDQEFDSCRGGGTDSISAFLNSYNNNINMDSNIGAAYQLYSFSSNGSSSSFAPHNIHQVSNFFSSLEYPNINIDNNNTNNHNHNYSRSNSNNQLDIVWPNKFPSIRGSISTNDTNCTTGGPLAYTITNNHQQQSPTSLALSTHGPPAGSLGPSKNPKKRSRASRRAPTTVLTTDTTNFRQMVQEFTGIPAPPFTSFSTRTRFDLFAGLGGHSCNNSNVVVQPPSYLLRPFPQKIAPLHQPQFLGNNTSTNSNDNNAIGVNINSTNSIIMNDGLSLAAVSSNTTASTCSTLPPTTFQLCDAQDYLSSRNPQLNFQSFLQSSASTSATVSASALALNDKYLLPALVQQDSSMSMGCTSVSNSNAQINCSVNNPAESSSYLSSISNTNTNTTSVATNGALDNIEGVTKGGEGMVDSWICSSD